MGMCGCGFSTEYPMCNGTHKVVKEIKDKIFDFDDNLLFAFQNVIK